MSGTPVGARRAPARPRPHRRPRHGAHRSVDPAAPKLLTLTCGDGNTYLKGMSWSSFGGATAQGKGTFVMNTCEPNCAEGKNVSYPLSVKATGSRQCKGTNVYSKLTLTFTGSRKPGKSVPRSWTFRCPA